MNQVSAPAVEANTAGSAPAPQRRRLLGYLAPLVLCPVVLIVAACYLVPTRWLAVRSGNLYLPNVGYGATLHNANCKIVIMGDSSAMVGIDPQILQARTGLSACNIADFEGMTVLNNMMVLDRYLAQNSRPRFLVFAYAPEDFTPKAQIDHVGTFEAVNWRMGQPGKLRDVLQMMRHPETFFTWVEQGLRLLTERALSTPATEQALAIRADHQGQLPIHAPALTSCTSELPPPGPDKAWIASLRARYGVKGTTVLMDIVPVPPCDPDLQYARKVLSSIADAPVQTFPLDQYTRDGRLHMNQTGATAFSNLVADQILNQEKSLPPAPQSSPGAR